MLKFYFNGSPNPTKVALFLEEAGLAYEPIAIDTRTGAQFNQDFLKVNPNGKVPAIDDDGVKVFDSNAILLYLAEKTGKFLPANTTANRGEMLEHGGAGFVVHLGLELECVLQGDSLRCGRARRDLIMQALHVGELGKALVAENEVGHPHPAPDIHVDDRVAVAEHVFTLGQARLDDAEVALRTM